MYHGQKPFIFISYAHLDSEIVYPVINGLEQQGFRVWYDTGIEAGSEWPEYIAEKIIASNVVLAFLSENSLNSFNCKREINFAIDENKELLVVHLEELKLSPGMKMQLNSLQAMFSYKFNDEQSFLDALYKARLLSKCKEEKTIQEKEPEKKIIIEEAPTEKEPEKKIIVEEAPAEKEPEKKIIIEEAPTEKEPEKKIIVEDATLITASDGNKKTQRTKSTSKTKYRRLSEQLLKDAALHANQIENPGQSFTFSFRERVGDRVIYNAIKKYADGADIDDVCAILDTTVFSSGKTGFLVTKTTLYSDCLKEKTICLYRIKDVCIKSKSHLSITYTDDTSKDYFFNIYYKTMYAFFNYIIEHSEII